MDINYQQEYESIYRGHWWYQSREQDIVGVVRELCKDKERTAVKILEIGCGPGLLLPKLMQFGEVEGIEPAESLFTYDESVRRIVHRISFPLESRKLPSENYDLILMLDVIEHIEDDKSAIHEVKRLLNKDGFFIITAPAFMSLWGSHDIVNYHFRRYTYSKMSLLISESGFHQVWGSYFFGWCFIPVWIVRRLKNFQNKNPKHDFKIPPPWLNTILRHLSCLDFKLARRQKLPFGTSLIIVAKKT